MLAIDSSMASGGADPAVPSTACPDKAKLRNMCLAVGNQMKDITVQNSQFEFLYQRKFHEAACIQDADTPEQQFSKYRQMWNEFKNAKELHCTNMHFDVDQGNILKYAVAKKFEEFIYDAIKWRLDLNWIDSDDQTLLDYVQRHLDRNKGNELEVIYKNYYYSLRKAGAKYRAELN